MTWTPIDFAHPGLVIQPNSNEPCEDWANLTMTGEKFTLLLSSLAHDLTWESTRGNSI